MKFDVSTWSRRKKIAVSVVGVFLALSVVGAIFGEDPATKSGKAVSASDSTSPRGGDIADTTAVPKETPTDVLRSKIEKEAGKKSNLDGSPPRIRALAITEGTITVELNGTENLSSGFIKMSNRGLVLDVIKALKKAGVAYDAIRITVYYPLVDRLGNSETNPVLGYKFSAAQIARIQPENVDTHDMDVDFADLDTYVHPAFAW